MRGRFRSQGYSRYVDQHGKVHECDTFTCRHCQRMVDVPAFAKPEDVGGMCSTCWAPVCPACVQRGTCDPFEMKLKRHEASYHALRSYGMV